MTHSFFHTEKHKDKRTDNKRLVCVLWFVFVFVVRYCLFVCCLFVVVVSCFYYVPEHVLYGVVLLLFVGRAFSCCDIVWHISFLR